MTVRFEFWFGVDDISIGLVVLFVPMQKSKSDSEDNDSIAQP
jgi:hypothetical protein